MENPRIQVAERNELDRLLDEKALLLTDLPLQSSEDRQLFGRFMYAKAMLFLEVYQARAGTSLSYGAVFDPAHKERPGRMIGQIRVIPHGVEAGSAQCEIIIGNGFKEGLKVELTG